MCIPALQSTAATGSSAIARNETKWFRKMVLRADGQNKQTDQGAKSPPATSDVVSTRTVSAFVQRRGCWTMRRSPVHFLRRIWSHAENAGKSQTDFVDGVLFDPSPIRQDAYRESPSPFRQWSDDITATSKSLRDLIGKIFVGWANCERLDTFWAQPREGILGTVFS